MFIPTLKEMKKHPEAANFIYDGVTTVITGNCGLSQADIDAYLTMVDSLRTSVNVAALIGHNDVRKAVMGTVKRDPTEAEMLQMEQLVEKAMKKWCGRNVYRTHLYSRHLF